MGSGDFSTRGERGTLDSNPQGGREGGGGVGGGARRGGKEEEKGEKKESGRVD